MRSRAARASGCRSPAWRCGTSTAPVTRRWPPTSFTTDGASIVDDPDIEVVLELLGGLEPARALVLRALAAGKPVVTGNKELLASAGAELEAAAHAGAADLAFEAAVAGGIPLIRPLRESLAGDRVTRMLGIVNGTTNYILTQMSERGWGFDQALAEAQRLGYAEADPTADVDGFDAAAKCAILASIAFDARVTTDDVYREGIAGVTAQDIADAARLGYVVKLLAIAELDRRRHHGARAPGHGAHGAPARERPRRVQRRVRRGGQRGPADVLRAGRGRGPHGDLGGRRPDPRRSPPRVRRAHAGRGQRRARAPDPPDGRHARAVLPQPARRGSPRRARRDRRGVRSPRRLDRTRLAGGLRRGGRARVHHPPRAGGARSRRRWPSCVGGTPCARSSACSGWRARSERGPARRAPVARADRGVPRSSAGHRRHAGHHLARGRHAAGPKREPVGTHRRRGLAQVRRRQSHRVVQGPRDDDGDLQGGGGGRARRSCAPPPAIPRPPRRRTRPRRDSPARSSCPRARSRWARWRRPSCTARACSRSRATSTPRSISRATWRLGTRSPWSTA